MAPRPCSHDAVTCGELVESTKCLMIPNKKDELDSKCCCVHLVRYICYKLNMHIKIIYSNGSLKLQARNLMINSKLWHLIKHLYLLRVIVLLNCAINFMYHVWKCIRAVELPHNTHISYNIYRVYCWYSNKIKCIVIFTQKDIVTWNITWPYFILIIIN